MRSLRQFSLRDALWLMVVVALLALWVSEKRAARRRELENLRTIEKLEVLRLEAAANAQIAGRMAELLDAERLQNEALSRRQGGE